MTSILRATAVLSTSSFVTILVGLVSAKAYALLIGPEGLGFMGLLLSVLGLTSLVAGVGLGGSVVRMIASTLATDDCQDVVALRRAAWLLFWSFGLLVALCLVIFRVPISRAMLNGPEHSGAVVLMGAALLFSLASGVQTSILNAYHRIGALAKFGILNSILGTALSLSAIWFLGEAGIPMAIVASSMVSFVVSRILLKQALEVGRSPVGWHATMNAAGALLRFGVPLTGSRLAGDGARLLLPLLVVSMLDKESVGFLAAATAIAVTYIGFLLTGMAQDYFPRVSAAVRDPHELVSLANQQLRLVLLLGVPMILGVLALSSIVLPLVYTPAFMPAVAILQWQLAADVLKLPTWVLGFVILVRSSKNYLIVELTAGILLLGFSWLGLKLFGLVGIGIGWLAMYAVVLPVNIHFVRREVPLEWTPENRRLMLASVLAVGIIQALPLIATVQWHTVGGVIAAGLFGLYSLRALWADYRLGKRGVDLREGIG